ncbi:alpha/beta hydrolase [Arthrobacter sp. zg-Y820]|uniref:alpha/beta hydrolase n=1 Tax=unclassified Arthrobacter TaxID=235627 RepID=UPI001E43671F|nr:MULTISPECIES: alpha/beta hydrolase [unclassified Arthrobacter]MCC9198381.1 alpha/beta hydrolase [Arthrobacter sp. zg-Y820]MDK1281251.1 alpha/beta hydrolase [Arthrobacter sp. zg.Y820]WIB09838.1 alpha/beta hydrolase [Arthrobacter sp. zg-Y820]
MTPASRFPRLALAAASAVVVLAGMTACTGDSAPDDSAEPAPSTSAASPTAAAADVIGDVPEDLLPYYGQEVSWGECEASFAGGFRCATVEVPMDYSDPDGKSIELAVILAESDGSAQGTVLLNPGGPGGSGYDVVAESVDFVTSERLRENFNVLGFDPRGVGRSTPVECLTDAELDESRAEYLDPSTPAGLEASRASAQELADKCAENSGDLLGFVDTVSAARDMDILRAVAGDSKLNYLGFSYGTFLGATYAELFPQNVGRMVLDGGLDPAASNEDITLGQAAGFEKAIRAYVEDCLTSGDCPLSGTPEQAVETIRALIASVEASPMTAKDGRVVTVSTFVSGFIVPLYNDQNWPALTQALEAALKGDPSPMLHLADLSADREADGSYGSNTTVAFSAVNCLDYPMTSDDEQMRLDAKELREASPTIGKYLGYGGITCEAWPAVPVNEPHEIKAPGAADMLVIGTTGDPATPYEWSVALAEQLDSATLVTWEGEGHTAYGRGDECIADTVDSYFIDGTVPADDTVCS